MSCQNFCIPARRDAQFSQCQNLNPEPQRGRAARFSRKDAKM